VSIHTRPALPRETTSDGAAVTGVRADAPDGGIRVDLPTVLREPVAADRPRWGSRRRRVLVVHSSDEMYGSDRVVVEVVGELAARDDLDVTVWLPSDVAPGPLAPLLRDLGARVERVPLPVLRRRRLRGAGPLGLARDAARTRRRLAAARPDLVWCATSACLVLAPLARSVGVPSVVAHLQETWTDGDRRGLAPLVRSATAVVAVSRAVLGTADLADDPRAVVVPNGVPAGAPPVAPPSDGPVRWVVASRWNPHKGHATLLAAWDAAGCPGELVVLGGPPAAGTGVDVPGLVETVVSRPETVTVVGEVDDATPWLRGAHAVLLPTDSLEGFGLVAIEAFREGRAVVASRSGGPEEVVEHAVTGWLFERGDVEGLARLLAGLDRDELTAAGRRAAAVQRERFTPERLRRGVVAVVEHELDLGRDAVRRPRRVVSRAVAR